MSRSNLGKYLVITYLYHFHIRKIYERSLYLHFLVKALMLFMALQKIWIQFITENCVGFFFQIKLIILSCIKHLLSIMNPFTIRDDVLPFLVDIANSHDASVVMAVVGKKLFLNLHFFVFLCSINGRCVKHCLSFR